MYKLIEEIKQTIREKEIEELTPLQIWIAEYMMAAFEGWGYKEEEVDATWIVDELEAILTDKNRCELFEWFCGIDLISFVRNSKKLIRKIKQITDKNYAKQVKRRQIQNIKQQIKKEQQEMQRRDRKPLLGFEAHNALIQKEIDRLQEEIETRKRELEILKSEGRAQNNKLNNY